MSGSMNKSLHGCVTGQVKSKANEGTADSSMSEHMATPDTRSMKLQAVAFSGRVYTCHRSCLVVRGQL